MAILSKAYKPHNFESHNLLKLSFTNNWGLHLNFVDCKSFLKSNFSGILALCETNLDNSIMLSSFNPKGFWHSYAWCHSLCERRTSFYLGLISSKLCRENSKNFTSLSVLLLFPLLITFFIFVHSFWFYFI